MREISCLASEPETKFVLGNEMPTQRQNKLKAREGPGNIWIPDSNQQHPGKFVYKLSPFFILSVNKLFIFFSFWLLTWHVEVSEPGIESMPLQWPELLDWSPLYHKRNPNITVYFKLTTTSFWSYAKTVHFYSPLHSMLLTSWLHFSMLCIH